MGEAERLVVTCPLTGRACMKEFCGWWTKGGEACSIVVLAEVALFKIQGMLEKIPPKPETPKKAKGAKKA